MSFILPNQEPVHLPQTRRHGTKQKVDRVVPNQKDESCGYGDLEMLTIKAYR